MGEQIAIDTDIAQVTLMVVKQKTKNVAIMEQAFGLFSNLVLRMPHIAERLYEEPNRLAMVAQIVMQQHNEVVGVVKTVLQTLRNLSKVEGAAEEMKESELFEQMRNIVRDRRGDDKWWDVVEIAKQFLREMREDDGVRAPPKHNDYY